MAVKLAIDNAGLSSIALVQISEMWVDQFRVDVIHTTVTVI